MDALPAPHDLCSSIVCTIGISKRLYTILGKCHRFNIYSRAAVLECCRGLTAVLEMFVIQ